MFPDRSFLGLTMDRLRLTRSPVGSSPTILSVDVSNVTETTFTVAWSLSEVATGQIAYGLTLGLGSFTTKETSFGYSTHIQTVSGLTAGLEYFFSVVGEDADGNPYASSPVAVTTAGGGGMTYDDLTLPTSWTHLGTVYQIDHTGVNDSTPGVAFWIADNAGGTNATNHKRLIFPATAKLRLNTALCLGGGVDHTTLWGHAATSSAWIRGDATSYQDVGCQLDVTWGSYSPHRSAFAVGAKYNGYQNITWLNGGEDFVIRGFDIRGFNPSPGIYPGGGYENQNALEYHLAKDSEFAYNKVQGLGGDLVRFRAGSTGHVHHNYVLNTGRMGCTAVINYKTDVTLRSDHVFEYNTIDRCGYWGIDVEPEDEATTSLRKFDGLVVRYNRWGTFASTSVGGGFAVVGGTAVPTPTRHIKDIEIYGNTLDGYGYGSYAGNKRDLWLLVAHSISNPGVAVGSDPRPQNITIRDNVVTHGAAYAGSYPEVLRARYTDVLVVTGNDANYGGADWMTNTGCTSVTESGNT